MSPKRQDGWVSKGILSACECFSCANKVAHRFKETKVSILCREPCNYRPLKGAPRSAVDRLTDIEQIPNQSYNAIKQRVKRRNLILSEK